MSRRSRARAIALQVLFQDDLNPGHNPAETDAFLQRRLRSGELTEFARSLVAGVRRNRQELDGLLGKTADNWGLERMAATDRNVLRLVAVESLGLSETPRAVIVAEAVRLASRYGSERSAPFVNGVAQALIAKIRGEGRGEAKGEPRGDGS